MNRQDFLRLVSKEIHFIFDRKSIERELSEHLDDSIEDLKKEGFSQEDAERQAIEQMGAPKEIGQLLNKEHHPSLGYVWMISKMLLICTVILTVVVGFEGLQSALDLIYPTASVGYLTNESHTVKQEFETKTHKIIIDYVCCVEEFWESHYITYRVKTKPGYIRAASNALVFEVGYDDEDTMNNLGTTILTKGAFGYKGYVNFEWPEDDVLYLHCNDGSVMTLNLEGYCDETR